MLKDGSRQVALSLDDIDFYHKERYHFASFLCNQYTNLSIIDCGCGIGYGSYILSKNINIDKIFAFDVCEEAIKFAKKHYSDEKINFTVLDFFNFYEAIGTFDFKAIVCFEVLEHIFDKKDDIISCLKKFHSKFDLCIWSLPIDNHSKFHKIVLTISDIYDIMLALSPKEGHICRGKMFIQQNVNSGNKYFVSYLGRHSC